MRAHPHTSAHTHTHTHTHKRTHPHKSAQRHNPSHATTENAHKHHHYTHTHTQKKHSRWLPLSSSARNPNLLVQPHTDLQQSVPFLHPRTLAHLPLPSQALVWRRTAAWVIYFASPVAFYYSIQFLRSLSTRPNGTAAYARVLPSAAFTRPPLLMLPLDRPPRFRFSQKCMLGYAGS